MNKVTPLVTNEVEHTFRELAKRAKKGEITYAYMLLQLEDDDHVRWAPLTAGDKSYDPDHMLAEIGQYYIITQTVFQDIIECMGEDYENSD